MKIKVNRVFSKSEINFLTKFPGEFGKSFESEIKTIKLILKTAPYIKILSKHRFIILKHPT